MGKLATGQNCIAEVFTDKGVADYLWAGYIFVVAKMEAISLPAVSAARFNTNTVPLSVTTT